MKTRMEKASDSAQVLNKTIKRVSRLKLRAAAIVSCKYRRAVQTGILLMAFCTSSLSAGDFSFYSIGKGLYYDQTGGGMPLVKWPYSGLFTVEVVQVSNRVSAVDVNLPTGGWVYTSSSFGSPFMSWERTADQAALDASFPDGNYTFQIATKYSGYAYVTNTMATGSYPNAPTVANLLAAQSVDPASDFTILWDAFAGGGPTDFVSCQLQTVGSTVFATPVFGTPGALDGTSTSVTVPGGRLLPSHAYLGRLVFATTQTTFTNAQWGASGATFLFSQTDFWLRTQGVGDSTPPAIAWTTPTNGASGLPSNIPVGVYFTKPMASSSYAYVDMNVTGGPLSAVYFSPDGLEAVLTFTPGSAGHHTLLFNPLDSPLFFRDRNGNPLAAESYVLCFTNTASYMTPSRGLLSNPRRQIDGTFAIDLQGQTNYPYTLQRSSNLVVWTTVATSPAFSGTARFVVSNAPPPGIGALYRGVAH